MPHMFQSFDEARRVIRDWMRWYNEARPHQALGYRRPVQYQAQQATQGLDFRGAYSAPPTRFLKISLCCISSVT